MQRAKEREIRETKRELAGYQGIMLGSDNKNLLEEVRSKFNVKSNKLKQKEKELEQFVKETGLKRNNERERVYGFNSSISKDVIKANKDFLKQKEYDTIVDEIKQCGIRGTVNLSPEEIDVESLKFDDNHINKERNHNVTEKEAKQFIQEAKISVTTWKGKFRNYFGENGAAYVNMEENKIRTAFSKEEYNESIKNVMEVLKKYGR